MGPAQGQQGVLPLRFRDFYVTPVGPRGLEFTAAIKELDGQRVRIVGYMVQSSHLQPGTFLLTPRPVKMDDCHYGLADDLPPQTLHVTIPAWEGRRIPFEPGLLRVTGRLQLGPKDQADFRRFAVRLVAEPPRDSAQAAPWGAASDEPSAACPHPSKPAAEPPSSKS